MTIHEQMKSLDMHSNKDASKDMQEVPQTCCAGPLWMWTHRNPDFGLIVFISHPGIPSSSFNTTFHPDCQGGGQGGLPLLREKLCGKTKEEHG